MKRRKSTGLPSIEVIPLLDNISPAGQDEIDRKQIQDPDFWLRRPMTLSTLDYSSLKIVLLEALYKTYVDVFVKYPHIMIESERYLDMYNDERPPPRAWFIDHDILPQEILERSPEEICQDLSGTRTCAGCRRDLHQGSFKDSFKMLWTLRLGEHGRLCFTCQEARRRATTVDARPSVYRLRPVITQEEYQGV
jgi:hypothetical protein